MNTAWLPVKDGDHRAYAIYRRHYSATKNPNPKQRQFVGPGQHIVLLTLRCDALFVWRKFIDHSGQEGVNCAVFRNEGRQLSSDLILDAEQWAAARWPAQRLYTYVNANAVSSPNPGYCFKMAGWTRCGTTKAGLIILAKPARGRIP